MSSDNNKLPASTTAIGSYLNAVRKELDTDAANKTKATNNKAAPKDFWGDVASGNDAAIKSILNNVDPVVAKQIRASILKVEQGNQDQAASTRRKGLLARQTTAAQRAQTNKELKGLKQPADPATTLARLIRRSMASKREIQAQLPGETPEAKITPATQRT